MKAFTRTQFAAPFLAAAWLWAQAASAAVIPKVEPNDTSAQAQNVDAAFTTGEGYGVENSATPMLPTIQPLVAEAGDDFSVNEGDTVFLGASGSSGSPPLSYSWTQLGGTSVTLTNANSTTPSFVAPGVALGGETLSFQLSVTDGTSTATDILNLTVVNVNHPPVADAGPDQRVAEGAPVRLSGENSFDIDNDPFTYTWVQTGGPAVILIGADGANPTFEASMVGGSGESGVVATLTFELLVDDGYPMDAPASGYAFENVLDRVIVEITDTNNAPLADAGADQTVDENSQVNLCGAGSSDPDGDTLSYSWIQEPGGLSVILTDADTASPSFIAPEVGGAATLIFTLTVDDGYGGNSRASVSVNILGHSSPPLANAARPTVSELWPPSHQMVSIGITGVAGEDAGAFIEITGVTQDEPNSGNGEGDTPIDAVIRTDGTVLIRSERSGKGDGRVYQIRFIAKNANGIVESSVRVSVPHSVNKAAADGGRLYDSTE